MDEQLMAELFYKGLGAISKLLKNIYRPDELKKSATTEKFSVVCKQSFKISKSILED